MRKIVLIALVIGLVVVQCAAVVQINGRVIPLQNQGLPKPTYQNIKRCLGEIRNENGELMANMRANSSFFYRASFQPTSKVMLGLNAWNCQNYNLVVIYTQYHVTYIDNIPYEINAYAYFTQPKPES